jgi:hypothetical protein
MRRVLYVAALLASPSVAHAQQASVAKPGLPAGWMARADDKADISKVSFTAMSRGWHVVTGPVHAIFYRPETTAAGNYTATLDAFFFGPPGQYPEGYGIFVGGKDLAGPSQAYLYFVAANNGKYLIKKRTGATTTTIVDWTASPAIKTVAAGENGNVENVFKIQARKDAVLFSINDVVVATRPRSELAVDGIAGFRINHSLSIHVAGLTVAQGK